jgi:hypothetical protein
MWFSMWLPHRYNSVSKKQQTARWQWNGSEAGQFGRKATSELALLRPVVAQMAAGIGCFG